MRKDQSKLTLEPGVVEQTSGTPEKSSELIEMLSSIWRRALNRPSIDLEDDFFDLGGDPWSAITVFSEISRILGPEVSPLLIYHTRTIRSLAAALQERSLPHIPAVTLLRPGETGLPPIFLVHGCGATIMEFFELTKHMRSRHPIYGMQARGTDGREEPFDRAEDLSEYHLAAIKRIQRRGPYLLVGYSYGGLVALEIARQLSAIREEIGLLVMMDSFPPLNQLSVSQLIKLKASRATHDVADYVKNFGNRLLNRKEQSTQRRLIPTPLTRAMRQFQARDYSTLQQYRARFYNGTVRFVSPKNAWLLPTDPTAVWGPMTKEFHLDTVPGDHYEMVTTYSQSVAAVLSRYLKDVDGPDCVIRKP